MQSAESIPLVAIACGGTGGHLFPGLAVAEALTQAGCAVELVVSAKEVDRHAVKSVIGMEVVMSPAVGLVRGRIGSFARGFLKSYLAARRMFKTRPPRAVLAMGGFTSAAPVLAGRRAGAARFLHESNSVPGRANRWLAPFVDAAFVGFPTTVRRLRCQNTTVTGTPVRRQFHPMDAAGCRAALGLDSGRPTLLVMGGSQGASAINNLMVRALAIFSAQKPELQFLHLTGAADFERVRDAYAAHKLRAVVQPFLTEMELALGAATAAISRSGASSLAELAAMRVPSVLIPYPSAADNHQFYNAWAYVESGAARMLEQEKATPEMLAELVHGLTAKPEQAGAMKQALAGWHQPEAAERIAARMLEAMVRNGVRLPAPRLSQQAMSGRGLSDRVEAQMAKVA